MVTLEDVLTLPAAVVTQRDPEVIANALNTKEDWVEVVECWLTDRGMVVDLVTMTGTTEISDSVLNKLDAAMVASRSAKAQINRLYGDPKGLNFGDPALRGWFIQNTPAVFSEQECQALLQLAVRRKKTTADEVEVVCKAADGRWLI